MQFVDPKKFTDSIDQVFDPNIGPRLQLAAARPFSFLTLEIVAKFDTLFAHG
jgi:hypothetical protein